MIDDSKNSVDSIGAKLECPPPARFDERASENAQPVRPISTSGVSVWIQRANYTPKMLTAQTKALALVLVGGLAIGTLGGTMLVQRGSSSAGSAPLQESTAETTAAQAANRDPGPNDERSAVQASAMALQSAGQTSSRIRRHRNRPPVQRGQQAYRVGVIK